MRARTSLLTLWTGLTLTAPALAQDAPPSAEEGLYEDTLEIRPGFTGEWRWSLGAQVFGAATRGEQTRAEAQTGVAASAELAYDVDDCRLFDLGAHVSLARAGQLGDYSGEQWFSACLMSGNIMPTMEIRHRLQLSVTPALSAPRRTFAVPYSAESLTVAITMLDVPLYGPTGPRMQFFRVAPTFTGVRQADAAGNHDHLEMAVDVDMMRYYAPDPHGDFTVDLFHVEVRDILYEALDVSVMSVVPLRLNSLQVGGGVLVDAELGWGNGSIWDPTMPGTVDPETQQVTRVRLLQDDFLIGRLGVRDGSPRLTLGGEIARAGWPTLTSEFVIETRATAWASTHQGKLDVSVKGFAALTEATGADGSTGSEPTGGGEVRASWALDHGFTAGLSAEAARSFYATSNVAGPLDASWGVRGFATVSAAWND